MSRWQLPVLMLVGNHDQVGQGQGQGQGQGSRRRRQHHHRAVHHQGLPRRAGRPSRYQAANGGHGALVACWKAAGHPNGENTLTRLPLAPLPAARPVQHTPAPSNTRPFDPARCGVGVGQVDLGGTLHGLTPLELACPHVHVFDVPTMWNGALWLPYRWAGRLAGGGRHTIQGVKGGGGGQGGGRDAGGRVSCLCLWWHEG